MKQNKMGVIRVLSACLVSLAAVSFAAPDLKIGVDANYSLGMEKDGANWKWSSQATDLFKGMAQQGVREFRVRLWMKDEGQNGKVYASDVVKRALDAGLNPYLVIFLSEDWSDMMKQPLPKVWEGLTLEQRAEAARAYSRDIVTHFRGLGLTNHLYEIGNEIDYGICGEYPSKGTKKNPATLSRSLWPRSAQIIREAQAGVREADPDARFMLHIAHWWDTSFATAFFTFMRTNGVQLDYAGLSYFPSANIGGSLEMEELGRAVTAVAQAAGCPVIIPESAYPSTRDFSGQFSRWKYETPGYPLTDEGQQRWVRDFFAFCHRHPDIAAVYYWSPEWYGEGMWKSFALFDVGGQARPAWTSFSEPVWTAVTPKSFEYCEVKSGEVFAVPLPEARSRMTDKVRELRRQTGGVTLDHITLLSNTALRVGTYQINLKSSLQNNICMTLADDARGMPIPDPAAPLKGALSDWISQLDPSAERVIILARNAPNEAADRLAGILRTHGLEADVHPLSDGVPLRFGMCGAFDSGETSQPDGL